MSSNHQSNRAGFSSLRAGGLQGRVCRGGGPALFFIHLKFTQCGLYSAASAISSAAAACSARLMSACRACLANSASVI